MTAPQPIPSASALADLKVRVDAATGPDRELDIQIVGTIREGAPLSEDRLGGLRTGFEPYDAVWPHVTSSLDAALALVERVLPGWGWHCSSPRRGLAFEGVLIDFAPIHTVRTGYGATAPLALLSALLSALIAKATGEG